MNLIRLLSVALVISVLSGCSWFKGFGDADNVEPPAELVDFKESAEAQVIWSKNAGKGSGKVLLNLQVGFADGMVFTADSRGQVLSFSAETGKNLWRADLDSPLSSGPVAKDDIVIVGSLDGQIIVLDIQTGAEKWRSKISSESLSLPAVDSNRVIVRAQDGRVYGFDAENGKRVWVYDTSVPLLSLRGNGSPLVRAGTVIIGFDSGKLVALRSEDGIVLWEDRMSIPSGKTELERLVDIDGQMASVVSDLYAVSFQGNVSDINLNTGETLWSKELSSITGLSVSRKNLAISAADGSLHLLDRTTGEDIWTQAALRNRQLTTPSFHNRSVVVGDLEGYLHWMDVDTGKFIARLKVDSSPIQKHPVLVGNTLYVTSASGKLSAIQLNR